MSQLGLSPNRVDIDSLHSLFHATGCWQGMDSHENSTQAEQISLLSLFTIAARPFNSSEMGLTIFPLHSCFRSQHFSTNFRFFWPEIPMSGFKKLSPNSSSHSSPFASRPSAMPTTSRRRSRLSSLCQHFSDSSLKSTTLDQQSTQAAPTLTLFASTLTAALLSFASFCNRSSCSDPTLKRPRQSSWLCSTSSLSARN